MKNLVTIDKLIEQYGCDPIHPHIGTIKLNENAMFAAIITPFPCVAFVKEDDANSMYIHVVKSFDMDGYLISPFPTKVRKEQPFTNEIATPWQGKIRIVNKSAPYHVKAEKTVVEIPIILNAYKEVMRFHLIAAQNEHVNDGYYYKII